MTDILIKFNKMLAQQNRNILLFLDNVSSHTPELSEIFSHIKVVFLSKNTTSRLQPLDAGIIKNFKVHYRKKYVQISSISGTASEIAKKVDVLLAIRWINQAWDQAKVLTIQNCFNHCGFSHIPETTGDPFSDLDQGKSLKEMVHRFDSEMSATVYINADEEIPTSATFDDENWREELCDIVISNKAPKTSHVDQEKSDEEETEDDNVTASSITCFNETIRVANDLLLFLTERGEEKISEQMFDVVQLI